jgi:hypothetical protein
MSDQPSVPISTSDEMSRGCYSNSMAVAHGPEEFIIDWFLQSPNGIHLVSRIIVTPGHMKRIVDALRENLERYEETFGEIRSVESQTPILQ